MVQGHGLVETVGRQLAPITLGVELNEGFGLFVDLGVELNEGFGLFVVAARTRLSAAVAHSLLRKQLPELEQVDLDPAADPEGEDAPPATMARLLSTPGRAGRERAALVRLLGGAEQGESWKGLFRRLNENRNAIIRDYRGVLVLVVSEEQTGLLATEAPDLWSVALVRIVGWMGGDELWQQMARNYAVLEALTLEARETILDAVRELGLPELVEHVDVEDHRERARRAFELWEGEWQARRRHAHGSWSMKDLSFYGDIGSSLFLDEGTFGSAHWDFLEDLTGAVVTEANELAFMPARDASDRDDVSLLPGFDIGVAMVPPRDPPDALGRLVMARQCLAGVERCLCVAARGMVSGEVGDFIRRSFDLVFEAPTQSEHRAPWRVMPGADELTPSIYCPVGVRARVEGSRVSFSQFEGPIELGDPEQLWLPGINRDDLGSTSL